jgi:hypothetical protein
MSAPKVEAFIPSDRSKTLYRVSTPSNSKRLIFDAEELAALAGAITRVLGSTYAGTTT